jgi:hypothetical protein
MRNLLTRQQPGRNGWRHFALRAGADINTDMAALKRQFRVVLAAANSGERFGRRRRHQMILTGIDI